MGAVQWLSQAAGAAALSVLTDATYFSGDLSYIAAIKNAVQSLEK